MSDYQPTPPSSNCPSDGDEPPKTVRTHRFQLEHVVVGIVALFTAIVLAMYAWNFHGEPMAREGSAWGTFGDYVGGLLNPTVAFAALVLLFRSIQLQKKELTETRAVLAAQPESARLQAELAGYTAAISASQSQVQILQGQRQFLVDQINNRPDSELFFDLHGNPFTREQLRANMGGFQVLIENEMKSQAFYKRRLRRTLKEEGLGGHHSEDNQHLQAPTLVNESMLCAPTVVQHSNTSNTS